MTMRYKPRGPKPMKHERKLDRFMVTGRPQIYKEQGTWYYTHGRRFPRAQPCANWAVANEMARVSA